MLTVLNARTDCLGSQFVFSSSSEAVSSIQFHSVLSGVVSLAREQSVRQKSSQFEILEDFKNYLGSSYHSVTFKKQSVPFSSARE